jgi:hypothetical protein
MLEEEAKVAREASEASLRNLYATTGSSLDSVSLETTANSIMLKERSQIKIFKVINLLNLEE